jgi:hypothetical protein
MASPKDKFETDAERMKSRGFAGYLKDRITGSADFSKAASLSKPARAKLTGEDSDLDPEVRANLKKGGRVSVPKKSTW